LKKNKNIGCRLFITTLQPLRLAFFNSITQFLTISILNHSLLLSIYYFFPILMLYNSKWSKIFQACGQIALKNESKKRQQHGHFSYKCELVKLPNFLQGHVRFLSIQMLISCKIHDENLWNFFHIFSNQLTTRSYNYMCLIFFLPKI